MYKKKSKCEKKLKLKTAKNWVTHLLFLSSGITREECQNILKEFLKFTYTVKFVCKKCLRGSRELKPSRCKYF